MYGDASWLDTAGRLLLGSFFLAAGLGNLPRERVQEHLARMVAAGTPYPVLLHWIGIALQFTGSALVLGNWHAEIGVYILIAFTVGASVIFHRFWNVADPVKRNMGRISLTYNIGMVGALLLLLGNVR